jgi:DNA-binding response OmpR family regulator
VPTVLLVEDERELSRMFETALRRHGYRVLTAGDGLEAIEIVKSCLPDLVIVDMMLPGASGFQVAQVAKTGSDDRVPVLMISGNDSPAHRDYAALAGVDLFLAKPFALSALTRAADRLCPPVRFAPAPDFASPPALVVS